MSSEAATLLRDIIRNNQSVVVSSAERQLKLGTKKYPFDTPTPFPGVNLVALYFYAKYSNRKEVSVRCQRLIPPIPAPQRPKGPLAAQINAWLTSTDNTLPAPQHTQSRKSSNNTIATSSGNHYFSFDDEPKNHDPSLAAFDIRLSPGITPNTQQNQYSYSIPSSTSETRSYAPPVESYSHSYSIPDTDVVSSTSCNYSMPTSTPSVSDRFGVPASAAVDVSRIPIPTSQNTNQERREREERRADRKPEANNSREQDRRPARGPVRVTDPNSAKHREREPTTVPRALEANYSSMRTDIKSSLVVTPPKEFWGPIVAIKKNHMNPKIKRPPYPHITLLAPFLQFNLLPEARTILREKLSTIQPFKIELNHFQIFYNKTSFTLYLNPTVTPAGSLERLYKACVEVFPQCTKGNFEAHIGVGYFHSRREAEMYLQRYQYGWQPFSFTVQEIYMMGRVSETDPFEVRQTVPLGGVDPVPLIKPVPF